MLDIPKTSLLPDVTCYSMQGKKKKKGEAEINIRVKELSKKARFIFLPGTG